MKPLPLKWDIPLALGVLTFGFACATLVGVLNSCSDREQDVAIGVIQTQQAQQRAIRTLTPR